MSHKDFSIAKPQGHWFTTDVCHSLNSQISSALSPNPFISHHSKFPCPIHILYPLHCLGSHLILPWLHHSFSRSSLLPSTWNFLPQILLSSSKQWPFYTVITSQHCLVCSFQQATQNSTQLSDSIVSHSNNASPQT